MVSQGSPVRRSFLFAYQQTVARKTYNDLPETRALRLHLLPFEVKMHPEQAP